MERWISLTAPLTRTRATMSNTELTQIEGALNTANCNNMVVNCPFVYSTTGLENSRTTPTSGLDLESSGSRTGGTLPGENTYGSTVSATKNGTQSSISSALSQGVSLSCNHTAICCNVFFTQLSNADSIPQTSEHLNYNPGSSNRSAGQQGATSSVAVPTVTAPSAIDLNKQTTDNHSYNSQAPAAYSSYQSKANSYNASAYGSTQTTASSYVNPSATSYVNNQVSCF